MADLKRGRGIEKLGRANSLYPVFARLDAESIDVARQVCRQWNQVLNREFITSLYCPAPIVSCPAFLLEFQYQGAVGTEHAALVMNTNGRFLRPKTRLSFIKGVTPNGLVVTSLFEKHRPYFPLSKLLLVTNVGSNASSIIKAPNLPMRNDTFRAASFDPVTRAFTYIEGYADVDTATKTPYIDLYSYASATESWTKLHFPFPTAGDRENIVPYGNGVFSWQTFFWVWFDGAATVPELWFQWNGSYKGVVSFSPATQQFTVIPLPASPLPDVENTFMKSSMYWELRGCEGNLFVFHNTFTAVNGSSNSCWRLVPSGSGYFWESFSEVWRNMHSARALSYAYHVCPQIILLSSYNVGWWLLADCDSPKPREVVDTADRHEAVFKLFDEVGNLRSCISMSQVAQYLQIPNAPSLTEVWPFEINNMCWPKHIPMVP